MELKRRTKLRDMDELEGSLLPPPPPMDLDMMVPIPFGAIDSNETVCAAVPVRNFVYPTSTAQPSHSIVAAASNSYTQEALPTITGISNRIVAEALPLYPERNLPTATYIPSYDDNLIEAKACAERDLLATATAIGKIKNEASDDAVQRGFRSSAMAEEWQLKEKVKIANKEGKRRDKEGLTVKKNLYVDESSLMQKSKISNQLDTNKATQGDSKQKGKEGYEVSEYQTSEYSGDTYDSTYEYKSVYDE
eukprot:CAMPEP_0197825182 /NCGR_PEP_ID=MMETSP1437-20131217/2307_1 /TAXON_ID=49252 ORGANISM="Eucampia antarctica, Strain CCMP1452" /NCGR_SAMPLE_ID=MMETSP1437 /ASSEMBLY_ACC=CAM_ASM_001096 /LENGTH=248 /DNA_ID=CAMNT_0043425077 /DNA_START=70 /DNA_END=816 /DNA_ORIENTATION=+